MTHDPLIYGLAALIVLMVLSMVKQMPNALKLIGALCAGVVVITMLAGVVGLLVIGEY